MKWTMDAPTKPGWYWWRPRPAHKGHAHAVRAVPFTTRIKTTLMVFGVGVDENIPVFIQMVHNRFPSCQWSDSPIQEPEEKA